MTGFAGVCVVRCARRRSRLARRFGAAALLLIACLAGFGDFAAAQGRIDPATAGAAAGDQGVDPGSVGGSTAAPEEGTRSDPLPSPSFERAYLHVFLAFGIAWALIFAYALLLHHRLSRAERDLARLLERER